MHDVPFVYIENTLKCNLKCTMCSNPAEHELHAMSSDRILNLIDFFSTKTDRIIFSGGESLIDPNIVKYVNRIPEGKEIVMLTNGTMFNTPAFREVCPRITELRVSIDDMFDVETSKYRLGSSPKRIIEDMAKARALNDNMIIVITCILNESIVTRLQEFVDFFIANEAEVDIIRFIPQIYYKGRAPKSLRNDAFRCMDFEFVAKSIVPFLDNYIKEKKYEKIDIDIQHLFSSEIFSEDFVFEPYSASQKCCEYQKGVFINNNGDLVYCPNSQLPIVNVEEVSEYDDLIAARDSALVKDKYHISDVTINEKYSCSNCRYMKLCGGGCPAITYNTTNDVLLPDFIKCSFNTVWEKYILPILPSDIKKIYEDSLVVDGTTPDYYDNIYSIVDKYQPQLHTEDYFGKEE